MVMHLEETSRLELLRLEDRDRQERLAKLQLLEDQLCIRAMQVVDATLDFGLIDPDNPEVPGEWIEIYGEKEAQRRFLVAKSGWLPRTQAPSALSLAARFVAASAAARGGGKAGPGAPQLNVQINLPEPTSSSAGTGPIFPEKDLE